MRLHVEALYLWLRGQDRQTRSLSNNPPDCPPNQLRPAGLLLGNSFAGSSFFYHNYKKTDTETASVFLCFIDLLSTINGLC